MRHRPSRSPARPRLLSASTCVQINFKLDNADFHFNNQKFYSSLLPFLATIRRTLPFAASLRSLLSAFLAPAPPALAAASAALPSVTYSTFKPRDLASEDISGGISTASRSGTSARGWSASTFHACSASLVHGDSADESSEDESSPSSEAAAAETEEEEEEEEGDEKSTRRRAAASRSSLDAPPPVGVLRNASMDSATGPQSTPYSASPMIGSAACARCRRTWCVRPVSGLYTKYDVRPIARTGNKRIRNKIN